jgi:MYXO-CTERM domain-containing protein
VLAFGWLASREAAAQTSTLSLDQNSIKRIRLNDPAGTNYPYRNARRWWVNYDECRNPNEEYFQFTLAVTTPGDPLEVWAGSGQDCAAVRVSDNRTQSCWIVATVARSEDPMTVKVPVRNIVARDVDTLTPPSGLGPEVCDGSTDNEGDSIKFYFFLQDGGQAVAGTTVTWDPAALGGTGFDLVGPDPPESITIGMGESQLSINLKDVDEESDRERFAAYCAPVQADETFIPTDGAAACATTDLMANARPNPALKCGEASETSNTITTDSDLPGGDLVNDQLYAIGVSGEDIVGNSGPLSPISCGTPKPLDDFFELYKQNGGRGGGGFCSMSPGSHSVPGATALLFALLAAFGIRRGRSRA